MRPDRLSVRLLQAKGMSGFGDPAEKRIKNERKIKLNGIENGMIPRKKTDKKGKKNKVNGVSGFGNLMSRKEAESRNCSAMLPKIPPEYPVKLMAGDLKGKNRLLT